MIFAYVVAGKDPKELMEKLKNVNLREKYADLSQRIKVYAKKAGRVAAKPLLIFHESPYLSSICIYEFLNKKACFTL